MTTAKTSTSSTATKATATKAQPKKTTTTTKAQAKKAAPLAIAPAELPAVELPPAVQLTGTALSKSAAALAEAWAIEQNEQYGLKLVRLVGTTLKGVFVPLLSLGAYGASEGIKAANTEEAKAGRAEHWQRFSGLFSGGGDTDEAEAAEATEAV